MLSGFLRERARLALVVVAATLLCWWLLRPSPPLAGAGGAAPPHDAGEEQLAAALTGRGLVLEPHSLLLPELPPAGGWGPLAWRVAIFAAAPDDDAAAPGVAEGGDIYRAELRFSAGSRLLDLRRLKNVTRTSSALERLLHGAGSRSLWSVQVGGMVRELLLVDAARDDREFEEKAGWAQHRLAALTNRLQTGQWAGVGLYSYNLLTPATRVEVAPASSDGRVSVLLFHGGEQAHSQATFDLGRQEVVAGKEEATFRPRFWAGTPVIHWMVDTVRSLPWVGP
ncbi:MAG: hypothetical protein FJ125_11860, partial [Deltaproteobacteria bacterium]|nr:hypothetical protein [Deltaproteobacteria bacterium]